LTIEKILEINKEYNEQSNGNSVKSISNKKIDKFTNNKIEKALSVNSSWNDVKKQIKRH